MRYYIHKTTHQEMGSISRPGEKAARGRYFFISKKVLDFFPHLSSVNINDKVVIVIVPLINDANLEKVYTTLDYHNQKYADITYTKSNPRDEIRLYLNTAIDPRSQDGQTYRYYYEKDDIAVFERYERNNELFYTLSRYRKGEPGYDNLIKILEDFGYRGNNALYSEKLDFVKEISLNENTPAIITEDVEKMVAIDTETILNLDEKSAKIEEEMGSSLFNSVSFRDFVMNAYGYKCAVTGKVIRYKDLFNLEAAHIKPQAHRGSFLPCNGIAMCRDMHWAFDKGFFTIDDNYNIILSKAIESSWLYREFNGKQIFVPTVEYFRPHKIFLQWHRNAVFEKFSQIRKL